MDILTDLAKIDYLISCGGGYGKYATSVLSYFHKTGRISDKQSDCLTGMVLRCHSEMRHPYFVQEYKKPKRTKTYPQYYSEEDGGTWGKRDFGGETVDVLYKDNGQTIYYTGGPCGPMEFDENGEMM